ILFGKAGFTSDEMKKSMMDFVAASMIRGPMDNIPVVGSFNKIRDFLGLTILGRESRKIDKFLTELYNGNEEVGGVVGHLFDLVKTNRMNMQAAIDHLLTLIFASHDTTANLVHNAL